MKRVLGCTLLLLLTYQSSAWAQEQGRAEGQTETKAQQEQRSKVVEFYDRYNQRFLNRQPKLGEPLPDVTAWDEHGEPFKLSSTRGNYTVIVFGCLT